MRFIILLVLAASCAPIYVPTTRNAPLFRGAGEFQASGYLTTGLDFQAAYAVTDHIGLTGGYSWLSQNQELPPDEPEPSFQRKNNFAEIGLGYYKSTRSMRFELYGGYGMGKGTSYDNYYFFFEDFGANGLVATGKYQRYYLQPSIATNKKKFNLAFTMRVSAVEFSEFSSDGFTTTTVTKNPDEPLHFFVEPALTGKFPLTGNLYGVFQLGVNGAIPSEVYFDYVPLQFSVGIQLKAGGSLRSRVY
ncbi:MAG: hypothetical protein AABY93_04635 [Bacteroidota bacterium]